MGFPLSNDLVVWYVVDMVESIAGEEPMNALFMLANPDLFVGWDGFVGGSEVGRAGGGLGTASKDELVDHILFYNV